MTSDRTSTGGRSRMQRMLGSGGKVALVGLVASLTTLGFTLWIQYIIRHQIEVGEPLARSTLELEAMLDRTSFELRGWVAYGDRDAKAARARIWREGIIPRLDRLRNAADALGSDDVGQQVQQLEAKLRRLRYLQWWVEDVARSPGDEPARGLYGMDLQPLEAYATRALRAAIFPDETAEIGQSARKVLLALSETDRALGKLLDQYSQLNEARALRLLERTRTAATQLRALSREKAYVSISARTAIVGANEVLAYVDAAQRVVTVRGKQRLPVTEVLYQTQLKPLEREVRRIAETLSKQQTEYARSQGTGLFRWSFAVLALALLMGIQSASSLYLSYRLEYRVQRALAKAKSLGQYVIDEKIGSGGMGEVYRAKHALLRRPSAVKVLRIDGILDPAAQERFQNEVQMTSQLSHPNTIAIFDYGRTGEGMFYYAMELLDGAPLNVVVDVVGPLPPSRVVHILKQICGSLNEAHKKGLLHRDIKPSNIMIAELGGVFDTVKVLDFGLVTQMNRPNFPQGSQQIVGTPAYLAPETIHAEEHASPKSDLYAIGAVGYFLLTGTAVFEAEDITSILRAHLEQSPQPPSTRLGATLPSDLEDIVLGCLAKDPGDRPKSAAILVQLLDAIDLPPWTSEDAEIWWEEYGEALTAELQARERQGGVTRTHIGARSALDLSRTRSS